MHAIASFNCRLQSEVTHSRQLRHQRRGAAALELAIALPVMMLLVILCVDFGRIAYFSIALNNAIGSGMTVATTHRYTNYTRQSWEDQIRLAVQEEMQSVASFSDANLQQTVEVSERTSRPTVVTLTVSYPFQMTVSWPGLRRSVVLRQTLTGTQYR